MAINLFYTVLSVGKEENCRLMWKKSQRELACPPPHTYSMNIYDLLVDIYLLCVFII